MKVLQTRVKRKNLQEPVRKEETLPSGESITKVIFMSGKNCCGSSFKEKV